MKDLNLAQSQDLYPEQKTRPGEVNTRTKSVVLRKVLNDELIDQDEILGPLVPEGAKILDAYIRINGSTGSGGIFRLGLKAGLVYDEGSQTESQLVDFAEDDDALVVGADAGGQAVFERAGAANVFLGSILKKVGKGGLQTFIKCTEPTSTLGATPRDLEAVVFYSLEH